LPDEALHASPIRVSWFWRWYPEYQSYQLLWPINDLLLISWWCDLFVHILFAVGRRHPKPSEQELLQ
jgi:hypothetical protein